MGHRESPPLRIGLGDSEGLLKDVNNDEEAGADKRIRDKALRKTFDAEGGEKVSSHARSHTHARNLQVRNILENVWKRIFME